MIKITLRLIIIGLLMLISLNTYSNQFSAISSTLSNNEKNVNSSAIPATENDDMKKEESTTFNTEEPKGCKYWLPFFKPFCRHLHQTWTEGNTELYLSGYAWHNRFTYSAERLREKNTMNSLGEVDLVKVFLMKKEIGTAFMRLHSSTPIATLNQLLDMPI